MPLEDFPGMLAHYLILSLLNICAKFLSKVPYVTGHIVLDIVLVIAIEEGVKRVHFLYIEVVPLS